MSLIKVDRDFLNPKQKLLKFGINTLSDKELLSIILRTGYKKKTALMISEELLDKYLSLNKISNLSVNELKLVYDINNSKSCIIASVFELSKRIKRKLSSGIKINNSKELYDFSSPYFDSLKEKIMVIYINNSNTIINFEILFEGGLDFSLIDQRILFKNIILNNSIGFFLIHNHPSGNPNPSNDDIITTNEIIDISKKLRLKLLDHIIITEDNYYSLADNGYI